MNGMKKTVPALAACVVLAGGLYPPAVAGGEAAQVLPADVPPWPVGCEHAPDGRLTVRSRVMGTVFTVRAYPGPGMNEVAVEKVCKEALACARAWERVMSSFDAESELSVLNAAPAGKGAPVSHRLRQVLGEALRYARLTGGAFDPALGPCIRLWRKMFRRGVLPGDGELEQARKASGWEKLHLLPDGAVKTVEGMRIDLGGIGKGFAVDRMAEVLRKGGVESFCIDSTSDVLAGQPPPGKEGWVLRVETAPGAGETLLLFGEAVSTSGMEHQFVTIGGVDYSHVVNPSTGLGVTEGRQVSVAAPSAAQADALATAACVMPEKALRHLAAGMPGVRVLAVFLKPGPGGMAAP